MNNPFGLPDEVMDAVIMAAINQSVQRSKKGVSSAPFKSEATKKDITPTEGAEAARKIYDSYVAAGFSKDQAFELLKLVLNK